MTKVGPLEIRAVILCEQVRDEANNKKAIIGTFANDIILFGGPGVIQIAAYMEFFASKIGGFDFELMFDFDGVITQVNVHADFDRQDYDGMGLPSIFIPVAKTGTLSLKMREKDGKWVKLAARTVHVDSPTAHAGGA